MHHIQVCFFQNVKHRFVSIIGTEDVRINPNQMWSLSCGRSGQSWNSQCHHQSCCSRFMLLKVNILEETNLYLMHQMCMTINICSTVKCWEHKSNQTFNKQDFQCIHVFRTSDTSSEEKVSPTETATSKCTHLLNAIILTWLEVSWGSKSPTAGKSRSERLRVRRPR